MEPHLVIGPWVLQPNFSSDARYQQADAALQQLAEQFHDDGYVVVPGFIAPGLVAAARAATETEYARQPNGTDRVLNAWRRQPAIRELACDAGTLNLVEFLLGRRAVPFQTLNFRAGTQQRAHADSIHFDTLPAGFSCGVWVALEDVHDDQGPLLVHPGSHRIPPSYPEDFGLDPNCFDRETYEELVGQQVAHYEPRRLSVAAGDAVVWASDLVHGGAPVDRAGASRCSQVTHFFGAGCVYVTPQRSSRLEGKYFVRDPLVNVVTRQPEPQSGADANVRLIRNSYRNTRVDSLSTAEPSWGVRQKSMLIGLARQVSWHVAGWRHFRR